MKIPGVSLLLFLLAVPPNAFAWVGGPYSGNTYDGITGGVFTATIRGKNVSGICKFSQSTADLYTSPFGDSIVYFKGMTYYGECYGFVDTERRVVSGVTNGSNWGADDDPNLGGTFRYIGGEGTYGVYNGQAADQGGEDIRGRNMSIANSSWNGRLTSVRPGVRFKAKGQMTFFGNGGLIAGLDSDEGATDVVTIIERIASGDFAEQLDEGEEVLQGKLVLRFESQSDFPKVTNRVRIKVFGGRTSAVPAPYPQNYLG